MQCEQGLVQVLHLTRDKRSATWIREARFCTIMFWKANMSKWKTACRYMPPGIQVVIEIDGEIFRDDANPAVLSMRRIVARGLRAGWSREKIIEQISCAGGFIGSADLAPGVIIRRGREDYYWILVLRPDCTQGSLHLRWRAARSKGSRPCS
jgi:hypothetical protein